MKVIELSRVHPDAHGILCAEHPHFANPVEAANNVLQIGYHVVGQRAAVHAAVLRNEADDEQEVARGLDDRDALALHNLRQQRSGQLQFILYLYLYLLISTQL